MPSIFKALASITVWVLFIWGCVAILSTTVCYYVITGTMNPPTLPHYMGWGLGTAQLVLAVVVMRLRQKME